MAPLWEPGSAYMYHAVTYGYLVGEVIRRVTGKMPGKFLADEVARPLGLEMWIGLPESEEDRVAPHFLPGKPWDMEQGDRAAEGTGVDFDNRLGRAMAAQSLRTFPDFDVLNTRRAMRRRSAPATRSATRWRWRRCMRRSSATVDGVRLLSDKAVARAATPDGPLMPPGDFAKLPGVVAPRLALGYALASAVTPMLGDGSFGHPGAGGRLAFAHPESGVAVGYTCNNMLWDG